MTTIEQKIMSNYTEEDGFRKHFNEDDTYSVGYDVFDENGNGIFRFSYGRNPKTGAEMLNRRKAKRTGKEPHKLAYIVEVRLDCVSEEEYIRCRKTGAEREEGYKYAALYKIDEFDKPEEERQEIK